MKRRDIWAPIRSLSRWPITAQDQARRNALVASAALAQRRYERDDVETFLRTFKRAMHPEHVGAEGNAEAVQSRRTR